jgi:hypothetical protein
VTGNVVPRIEPPEADAVIGASVTYYECLVTNGGWGSVEAADEWLDAVQEYVESLRTIAAKEEKV